MKKKKQTPTKQKMQSEKAPFICQRCGYCCICSTPAFTKEEYKKVRDLQITKDRNVKFIKVTFDTKIENRHIYKEYAYFTENGYKTLNITKAQASIITPPPCEFLDKDENGLHSCAIYSHRPSVCRDFGIKEWECPNNPDYLKKVTKWSYLFFTKNI